MNLKNVFIIRAGVPWGEHGYVLSREILAGAVNVYNARVSNGRSGYGEIRSAKSTEQIVLQKDIKPNHMTIDILKATCKVTNLQMVGDIVVADIEILNSENGKLLLDVFSDGVPECTELKNSVIRFEIRAIVTAKQEPIVDSCVIVAIDSIY